MNELQLYAARTRNVIGLGGRYLAAISLKSWKQLASWVHIGFDGDTALADGALVQAFKPDAAAIEEAPVPVSAHLALYVVLALLIVALLWAVFGSIDRIVVAPGKIATQTPLIVMQPFATSRVLEIRVRPGDHVRKGQVIASFDPAFAQADVVSLAYKAHSLKAQVARLEAELNSGTFSAAGGDLDWQAQAQIFQQEMAEYSAELARRDHSVAELDSQIKASTATVSGLRRQFKMAQKVEAIYRRLFAQKAVAPLDVMKAQSNTIDFSTRLESAVGDEEKLRQQRAEAREAQQSFLDRWRGDHNKQLVQAQQDLVDATETLHKARTIKDLTEMRAPANAVVLEAADRSPGSVLREAETLVTLVPDDAKLYIAASIPAHDIGYVKAGEAVRVKLDAYPFQRYGTLNGSLASISPDSLPFSPDKPSQLVYRARVKITDAARALVQRGIRLRPGMVVTAQIKTGKHSIISYILNPILRIGNESLKEP